MNPYDRAVYIQSIGAVVDAMAKAAAVALLAECAGATDAITKAIFAEAVVALLGEIDEADVTGAVRLALEARP